MMDSMMGEGRWPSGSLHERTVGQASESRSQPGAVWRRRARCGSNAAALLLTSTLALLAVSAEASDLLENENSRLINGVVATIDGDAVTLLDLKKFRLARGPFMPAEFSRNLRVLFDSLLESRLLKKEVERNGITTTDREVDAYIANVLRNQNSTREQIEVALAESGVSWDDYYDRMREEVERFTLVNLLIRSRVNVTPEEIEREWREDPRYLESEKLEIAHIFLAFPPDADADERAAVAALAEELHDKASGRGFASVAKKYSDGPTAEDGGLLGSFEPGTMAPHFEEAVAQLDEGEVSRPVTTDEGVHLVKLVRNVNPKRVPLEDVREEIHNRIYDVRLDERYTRWAREDLRKDHHVTTMIEELALLATS